MKDYRLFLFGAGGHAKVIADMCEGIQKPLFGAIDKNLLVKSLLDNYPVYHSLVSLDTTVLNKFVVAVGNNTFRKRIVEQDLIEYQFDTIIDRNATVSNYAEIGEGSVVMAGATINVDVQVGRHCIINTNASVDHDSTLEDYVHISPNVSLAGNVLVGEGTHVGIGACVIQGVNVGRYCTIGAGTVVLKDVPNGATVVGNPGRIIKIKDDSNL